MKKLRSHPQVKSLKSISSKTNGMASALAYQPESLIGSQLAVLLSAWRRRRQCQCINGQYLACESNQYRNGVTAAWLSWQS